MSKTKILSPHPSAVRGWTGSAAELMELQSYQDSLLRQYWDLIHPIEAPEGCTLHCVVDDRGPAKICNYFAIKDSVISHRWTGVAWEALLDTKWPQLKSADIKVDEVGFWDGTTKKL